MWWHRDLAPAHISRAFVTPGGGRDETHAQRSTPPRNTRRDRPTAGLGPPSARARVGHVPGPARPDRPLPGRRQEGSRHLARGAARGDHGRGDRCRDRQPAGSRRDRDHRPHHRVADRAGVDPAGRALATAAERRAADAPRPRAGDLAPPRPASPVGAGRRVTARFPWHPRRGGVHRDPDSEVRGVGYRVRGERLRSGLLRPTGVPRAEPAVLQAAAGGCLRAGLRGRPRVPRRAARHRAPPGGVRLPRRRAGLHRRPPRRAGDVAAHAGRHGRSDPRVRRAGSGPHRRQDSGGRRGDPGRALRRGTGARRRTGGRARPLAGDGARPGCLGTRRARQRLPGCRGLPDDQAAVLHPPPARRPPVVEQLRPALSRS